mmetsp:Transcript_1016/g.1918  ORF Transcript_1016/g.1918 Transcript_1016/m.1918 type:complete len:141 (-) Transcript_1016:160-582(-)
MDLAPIIDEDWRREEATTELQIIEVVDYLDDARCRRRDGISRLSNGNRAAVVIVPPSYTAVRQENHARNPRHLRRASNCRGMTRPCRGAPPTPFLEHHHQVLFRRIEARVASAPPATRRCPRRSRPRRELEAVQRRRATN